MNHDFEKTLKQDGKHIQAWANQRLFEQDLSHKIMLEVARKQQKQPRLWHWTMAAAICLSVITAVFISQPTSEPIITGPLASVTEPHTALPLKQLSSQLEQSVNQPLIEEQQAIIKDLKQLKKSFLSI